MKKIYALPLLAFWLSISLHAQTIFYDDFESYPLGPIATCEIWSTWSGIPDDGTGILVVDDITMGNKSGYVGPGSPQNILLDLRNQTTGDYTLRWEMYITSGSTGYFNIQGMTATNVNTGCQGAAANGNGILNSGNLYFNRDGGAPGILENANGIEMGTYPEDAWFIVSIYFDLSFPSFQITLDGTLFNKFPVLFQGDEFLGAINFVSIDSNNNYWVDNVHYFAGILATTDEDILDPISVYPNPVKEVLTIRSTQVIDTIEVYNVLGKMVLKVSPDRTSPTINMSDLSSGIYFVKAMIGSASQTIKVVK